MERSGSARSKITVVGAGISGLATAQAILSRDPQADVTVLESDQRVGGKVWTESGAGGYLCEGGVNGFLDKVPRTLALCRELGLDPVPADAAAQQRFIFSESRLHRLPEKPAQFLFSQLLSLPGRLRVMGEVAVGRGAQDAEDESLAHFATRRLGREASDKLIDPMASGVFAGDAQQMSLKSCFPRIHEVEQRYGGLIRGLVTLQRQARREGRGQAPGPGPGGHLTSFAGGMSTLTDALAALLGARVRTAAPVDAVSRTGRTYTVHLAGGERVDSDVLILAIPAYAQAQITDGLDPELARLLAGIDYPPLSVVCLGYRRNSRAQFPGGFGFLVPSRERRSILGTIVDSNVFPGRAPPGHILLRSMVGGARNPGLAHLPDDQLVERVSSDLRDISGLAAEPEFCRVFRHEQAIPQYCVGHSTRLDQIDRVLTRHPGLVLTGNAFRGVSLNDCVTNAWRTAAALVPQPAVAVE